MINVGLFASERTNSSMLPREPEEFLKARSSRQDCAAVIFLHLLSNFISKFSVNDVSSEVLTEIFPSEVKFEGRGSLSAADLFHASRLYLLLY